MSELLALGISHKTAPVELRERVALLESQIKPALRELRGDAEIHEAVAISTCNRTELYLVAGDPIEAETAVLALLTRQAEIRPTELADSIYSLRNCDAARHLYRVASGLESMIVGEHEVLGQVKAAYDTALEAHATGPLTNKLFNAAIATGRRVRSETAISVGRVSVPSVAVDLARETIGELAGRQVVVLGTGDMSELLADALAGQGVHTIFVANRRRERALALAQRFGGRVVGVDELPRELEHADIALASTSSPHAIVSHDALSVVMDARGGRPLLLIDIAVPRDIDPVCREIEGVTLYDIDDIEEVVSRNRSVRQGEARRAEAIIEEEIQRFAAWLGSLDAIPTIAALRSKATDIVDDVLAENEGRWESLSEKDRERITVLARTIANRLLHEPTAGLRRTGDERAHARIQLVRELFALDGEEDAIVPAGSEDQPAGEVRELRRQGRPPAG
jgi:glutamyl-tRNA reductase